MWNELESYKNLFLQHELPHLKSENINQLVLNEMNEAQSKRDRCKIPNVPKCEHSTYLDDHSKLAYGWFALPKLLREMRDKDYETRWRAINSLSEFLLNPLEAQKAITEFDIIRLAQNLFMRTRLKLRQESFSEIARFLRIFYICSIYLNGAEKIAQRCQLRKEIYKIILNREKYEVTVSSILRNLSEKPKVLLYLLEKTDAFDYLTKIFHQDPCVPFYPEDLWIHLSHFLEIAPEKAVENGFFELFHRRIVGHLPHFHHLNMKCFALLLRCNEGQKRFDDVDGVRLVYKIFNSGFLVSHEFVMLAFLNGLQSKRALWRCREFTDLPNIVVRLAKRSTNPHLQLYSLQALRQMCTMPCIKNYVRVRLMDKLTEMNCVDELVFCKRCELVTYLKGQIFESDPKHVVESDSD